MAIACGTLIGVWPSLPDASSTATVAHAASATAGDAAEMGEAAPRGRDAKPPRIKRVQRGYATFLAKSFHGEEAASGEIFDSRKLVAAHRTLPFGSMVRITNLENGRVVTVRIMDRGPYGQNWREGTIIDLSRAAARRLDMIEDGQVRIRLVVLRVGDDTVRARRSADST